MKQSELLNDIQSRENIISVSAPYPAEVDSNGNPIIIDGVQCKYVIVTQLNDNKSAIRKREYFYVINENTLDEKAYFYSEKNEIINEEEQFSKFIIDYIYNLNYAEYIEFITIDEENKRARAKLYKTKNENIIEAKEVIIWKDKNNILQIRYIENYEFSRMEK